MLSTSLSRIRFPQAQVWCPPLSRLSVLGAAIAAAEVTAFIEGERNTIDLGISSRP